MAYLLSQSLVFLPGSRDTITELIHQRLVEIKHHRRGVMAQAKEPASKGAGVVGVRLEVAQHLGGEQGLKVERKVVLTVDGLGDQLGFGKDHVGPALALLVEAQDLCREQGTVHFLEIDLAGFIGVKLLVDFGAVHAGGVEPDGDPGLVRRARWRDW